MKVVIAGASGFIGHALVAALRADRHEVLRLTRGRDLRPDAIAWDPARRQLDPAALEGAGAIVNLAGENIAGGRWTQARRQRILRSRIDSTATLSDALKQMRSRPRVLVNASATGFYGDRADEPLTELSGRGPGFLADVCAAWEREAERATALGLRTVCLRFGVVLAHDGGVLGKMLPLFRLGLGGRLGHGRQWMSWIMRDDVIGVIRRAIEDERYNGPLNVTAPKPVTNAEFTRAIARTLHRPAIFPAPAWALRLAFGRAMVDEALLASTRAMPARLQELGFEFQYPDLDRALSATLKADD